MHGHEPVLPAMSDRRLWAGVRLSKPMAEIASGEGGARAFGSAVPRVQHPQIPLFCVGHFEGEGTSFWRNPRQWTSGSGLPVTRAPDIVAEFREDRKAGGVMVAVRRFLKREAWWVSASALFGAERSLAKGKFAQPASQPGARNNRSSLGSGALSGDLEYGANVNSNMLLDAGLETRGDAWN